MQKKSQKEESVEYVRVFSFLLVVYVFVFIFLEPLFGAVAVGKQEHSLQVSLPLGPSRKALRAKTHHWFTSDSVDAPHANNPLLLYYHYA